MGSAPSAPANTTSTTTVNQSPWQNPTYQALMLGDANNPGPVTSMLRASNALMQQYNTVNQQGLTQSAQAALGSWNPGAGATAAHYINQLNPDTGQYVPTLNPNAEAMMQDINARQLAAVPQNPAAIQQYAVRPLNPEAPITAESQQKAGGGIMSLRPGEPRRFAAGGASDPLAGQSVAMSTAFNPALYLALNPDVARSGLNPAYHWNTYGMAEGRTATLQEVQERMAAGQSVGVGPVAQQIAQTYNANKSAFDSGLLTFNNTGGAVLPDLSGATGAQKAAAYTAATKSGIPLSSSQNSFLSNYNTYSNAIDGKNVTIDANTGMPAPAPAPQGESQQAKKERLDAYTKATGMSINAQGQPVPTGSAQTGKAPYSLTDTLGKTAYFDPTTGQSTLPDFLQLQQQARNLQTPEAITQGQTDIQNAAQALQEKSDYTAQQVNAQQVSPTGYTASGMAAPQDVQAQNYTAAQAQAAQMAEPQNIKAVQAQAAQANAPSNIAAQQANIASMAGPQNWTTAQAQQYMNPYAETALAAQQRLANINYAQQNNQLMSQAASQGAYGGSRAQLSLALNKLNQDIANQNLAAQGMNTAYQTGLGAFQTQTGMQQAAAQSNQQAYNTAYNNYVAQGMTAQQANQAAQLAVTQLNAQNQQQANLSNQATGMAAQQANQQAALTTGQANLNAAQQTALSNQQATNAQKQQFINNALQAATTSYGGKLTAAQQNQVAQNAAAQFNAQQGQQANMANQQANLTAQTQNQQAGLSANQQNLSALQGAAGAGAQLGNLGATQNQTQLANLGALGQSAQAQQNLAQQYLNTQQQNAATWLGLPATVNAPAANVINSQPVSGGSNVQSTNTTPATWASGGVVKDSWASGKKRQKNSWAYASNKSKK